MECPKCGGETEVKDSRNNIEGQRWRRRVCLEGSCQRKFTTYEISSEKFKDFEVKEGALKSIRRMLTVLGQ